MSWRLRGALLGLLLALPTCQAQAQSLTCNGTSDYGRATSPFVTVAPFTLAVRFRPTDLTINRAWLGLFYSGSATVRFSGFVVATTGIWRLATADSTSNTSADATTSVTVNTWQLGGGLWTSTTARQAVLNTDVAATVSVTSRTPLNINRLSFCVQDNSTQAAFAAGQIASVYGWNVDLNTTEWLALAKGISPFKIRPQNLKLYIPFMGRGAAQDWFGTTVFAITGTAASTEMPAIAFR